MKRFLWLVGICLLATLSVQAKKPATEVKEVKNVIFMIGDGMGLAQVSMLQIGNDYAPMSFNRAQGVALATTRSANNRVTDSAAAGTALATGHKTNNSMLGQTPDGESVPSMLTLAAQRGAATGLVVTCYLQHATPAAFYAHVPNRGDNAAITRQMLSSEVDVLLGGGKKWLAEQCDEGGSYLDAFRRRGYSVVESMDEADRLHSGRLLGVFADEHLPHAAERGNYLSRATGKALEVLSADAAHRGKGFFLMVEGSQIDMAGHANDAAWMLDEMRDFDSAVSAAMDFADHNPGTLVVITADHETGGVTLPANEKDFTRAENGVQYKFSSYSHTATLVPIYLYGTGADRIRGVMDNTELSRKIMELLRVK